VKPVLLIQFRKTGLSDFDGLECCGKSYKISLSPPVVL
jgi:hypothetical protein